MYSLPDRARSAVEEILAGGGEMGALMRSMDWSHTAIGPVEQWPQSLRTAVSICLASRFPMLIWWGPELVMLYNDAYRPILGATKHPRSMGQRGRECWPEIWDVIGPMLEGVLERGAATWSDDQLLLLDRNGYVEECYFTFSYSPIRDESGGIGGVFTAVTETTARVLGERRLRSLRALAASASEALTTQMACERAVATLAENPADFPFAQLYLVEHDGTQARLAAATGTGAPHAPEVVSLAPQPPPAAWPLAEVAREASAAVVPLHDMAGEQPGTAPRLAIVLPIPRPNAEGIYGFLVSGINVRHALDDEYRGFFDLVAGHIAAALASAHAHEEERLRAEALAALNRAKVEFFSNVSHEFRTPLTLLLGPLEDALADSRTALDPERRNLLEVARRNALRLHKMVDTLLEFSRIESGRIQAVYAPVDLAVLTAEVAGIFRAAIERAGLRYVVSCPPLTSATYVDPEKWEQIVLNLLSNAFKFTLRGEIALTLRAGEGAVVLEVRDTGIGIAAEEVPQVFERFHRVRDAQGRTFEGSGIGLALVRDFVHLHGGTVRVASTPGVGSTFTVTLPVGAAHLPADRVLPAWTYGVAGVRGEAFVEEALRWLPDVVDASSATPTVLAAVPSTPPVAKVPQTPRVLVVDDNADMRAYLHRLLAQQWAVETAKDGLAALESVRRNPPHLVLTDVMMPRMDGTELLRALRADARTQHVPVILLSARAGDEAAEEGLAAGADDYLVKPFSARELRARVAARLELAHLRSSLAQQEARRAEQLRLLADSSLAINATHSLKGVLKLITEAARMIIGAHQALTSLTRNEDWAQSINTVSLSEKYAKWRTYAEQPNGTGIYALVCRENRPLRLTQAELEAHPAWRGFGEHVADHPPLRGWLAAPLVTRDGRNLGLIQLSDKLEGDFTAEDEAILVQLAQMASVAVSNVQLYEAERDARAGATAQARELEAMIEAMTDSVYVFDAAGAVVRQNTAATALFGAFRHDPTGTLPVAERHARLHLRDERGDLLPYEQWPHLRILRGEVLTGDQTADIVVRNTAGADVHLSISGAPVLDEDGTPVLAVCVCRDVTERRRLEHRTLDALNALLAMAESLVQVAPAPSEPTAEATQRGREVSEQLRRLMMLTCKVLDSDNASVLGVDATDGALRPLVVVGIEHEADVMREVPGYRLGDYLSPDAVAHLQRDEPVQLHFGAENGTTPPTFGVRSVLVLPMVLRGEPLGVLAIGYSSTEHVSTADEMALARAIARLASLVIERERLLQEREQAQASALALEAANKHMDEFLGMASHELLSPVTTIKANVQLASRQIAKLPGRSAPAQSASRLLGTVDQQIIRLTRLVRDLLDVSRFQAGRLDIREEVCDLAAIVHNAVLEQRASAAERHIIFKHQPRRRVRVYVDPVRVGQVVTNYLTNALKYSPPETSVEVTIEVLGGQARVAVRDSGPGLPPLERERVWERFHRAPGVEAATGSAGGLGLGLYISKNFIERQGGAVGVESEVGQGSTFWLSLPLLQGTTPPAEASAEALPGDAAERT